MPKQYDIEKKFGEYIDRILAGEEITKDPSMDEETRADLVFVKKACKLGPEPTPQFQARLRAVLIEQLEARQAQKTEEGWKFFRILRQPAWQAAIAAVLVILVVTIVWREGVFQHNESIAPSSQEQNNTPPAPNGLSKPATTTAAPTTTQPKWMSDTGTAGQPVVSIDAKTDKKTYHSGETVSISISMKNVTGQPLNLSNFPPIMSLIRSDSRQPVYTFQAGTAVMNLAPNQTATYTYTWNETDFKGQPVTGSYYVELEDLEYNGQPYKLNLNNPVKFQVLPMDKQERSPTNGATLNTQTPTFIWAPINGATEYEIQLSIIADFSSVLYTERSQTTLCQLPSYWPLMQGKQFYWRVRAIAPIASEWLTVYDFYVLPPATVIVY